jgi:hypothetical protein
MNHSLIGYRGEVIVTKHYFWWKQEQLVYLIYLKLKKITEILLLLAGKLTGEFA